MPKGLPFTLSSYLELLDLTGRWIKEGKSGFISADNAPILQRLSITTDNWLALTTKFEHYFSGAVGAPHLLSDYCQHLELKRRHQISRCQKLFNTA